MPIQLSHILIVVVYLATFHHLSMPLRSSSSYSMSLRQRRQAGNTTTTYTDSISDWSESEEMSAEAASSTRWLSHRESQMLLRREGGDSGSPVDCCPSTLEMIEPQGGINREGMLVQIFSGTDTRQRFFELSCRNGVEGRPCRFMDRHLHNQSRCVQKYSYTYAIVRDDSEIAGGGHHKSNPFTSFPSGGSKWMLDHIKVRSGCACVVSPRTKRRRLKSKRGKD